MGKLRISELQEDLSVAEKIELVQDIWDNIAETSKIPDLTEEQKKELDKRSNEIKSNPDSGVSWEKVKEQLRF